MSRTEEADVVDISSGLVVWVDKEDTSAVTVAADNECWVKLRSESNKTPLILCFCSSSALVTEQDEPA